MPDEQPTTKARPFEPDDVAGEVFRIIAERYPALVPLEELVREFDYLDEPDSTLPAIFVREAVERLYHDGLAHRIEGFVFATRASVRAIELRA